MGNETNNQGLTQEQMDFIETNNAQPQPADKPVLVVKEKPTLWKRFVNSKPIRFVRKHKVEIGVGIGVAAAGAGAAYLAYKEGVKDGYGLSEADYEISSGEEEPEDTVDVDLEEPTDLPNE